MEQKRIETLPVVPLRNIVTFPNMVSHFDVGRSKSLKAVEEAELKGGKVFLVAQKKPHIDEPKTTDIYYVGAVVEIKQVLKLPQGQIRVLIEAEHRAKVVEYIDSDRLLQATVEILPRTREEMTVEEEAAFRMIKRDLESYVKNNSSINAAALTILEDIDDPSDLIDMVSSYMPISIEDSQNLLEIDDRYERMLEFHRILQRELELQDIEEKIAKRVKDSMSEVQKEYYLREQIKAIREELGEDDEASEMEKYLEQIQELNMPEENKELAIKEAKRLEKINPNAAEYGVIINYLDWIIDLPWDKEEDVEINIKNAQKILDEDHYGLEDVKERIIEFLALRKLSDKPKGPILCLVGPPGVGKTSIARSIARSLDREFVRMSLGGVTDESEIRGHRRTYVGAMPGSILSNIKNAGTSNPVFLLDEIDKLDSGFRGDPSSALLEVLDPEQNNTFTDRFLDMPYDLSQVLFLTTANNLATIPAPLRDRMEIITISGYTPLEKLEIAKRYILPKQLEDANIEKNMLTISDNALMTIIEGYTREAGVRDLERQIQKIIRKAAVQIVRDNRKRIRITDGNIHVYLGARKFLRDEMEKEDQVGVANGLAYTAVGGTTLSIEANITKGKGKVSLTGQLGDVMKESAQAALTYIRSISNEYGVEEDFINERDLHLHVPEGATPKDGPSAGITMATAMISALTGKKVRKNVAMTGEITLRGRVLPIGGLKEKLLAAGRMGIDTVIIPRENERDLDEIESVITDPLEIIPVEDAREVFEIAIVDKDEDK